MPDLRWQSNKELHNVVAVVDVEVESMAAD